MHDLCHRGLRGKVSVGPDSFANCIGAVVVVLMCHWVLRIAAEGTPAPP